MRTLGPYEIEREVARGGMGVVYRARGPLGAVAIKVLLDPASDDPRFLREAQAGFQLRHPGIVRVHDLNHDEHGRPYLVMEWVEGESLEERLRRGGPLPIDEALRLTRLLCEALAYAHRQGVIHRDLKPANVLLGVDDQPRITDFGLTRFAGVERLTRTGTLLGTPAYMPPEQAAGEPRRMGPSCDIYSLGATLYAMLCGRPPFEGATTLNVLRAVLDDPPPSLEASRPDAPPWLAAAVRRCLAKEPEQRFPDAEALESALRAGPTRRRPPALALPAACGLLALLAGVAAAALDPAPTSTAPPESHPAASPLEVVERATELAWLGHHDEAAALLAPILALRPRTAEDFLARALARDSAGGSRADIERALELDPDLVLALTARSRVARHLEDLDQADRDSARALRLAPDALRALVERANVLAVLGRREESLRKLDQARRQATEADGPRLNYAEAELRWLLGDFDQALAAIARVETAWPGSANMPWLKGQVLLAQRRFPEAIRSLERSLELRPDTARLVTLAHAYHRAGDPAGTERTFRRAIAQAPQDVALCVEWAAFLSDVRDRPEDAIAVLNDAIAREPRGYEAYMLRGEIRSQLAQRDQQDAALNDMGEALLLRPDARLPRLNIGILLFEQRAFARAARSLTRALEPSEAGLTARQQATAYAYRALTRGELGDRLGAEDDMARARASSGLRDDLRKALGQLEEALSRR